MKIRNLTLVIITYIVILSCNKEINNHESIDDNHLKSTERLEYFVEKGILNIRDYEVFEKLIVENSKKTINELIEWQNTIGFNSFQVFYSKIFDEYEEIVQNESPIERLHQYVQMYSNYIEMPGGTIDGLPDYSIKPKINALYASVANIDGLVKINGKIIDAKNAVKLKSSRRCYKNTSSRRMWVEVFWTHPSTGNIMAVEVSHQKKVLFAWVSYSTQYYWELFNPPLGYWYTPGDVPNGYAIYMPQPNGTSYLRIWNRGVGENNAAFSQHQYLINRTLSIVYYNKCGENIPHLL